MKDSMKYLLVSGIFFEELGFTYLGPVDGHNYEELLENLRYAKKTKGPVLLHVITKKARAIPQPNWTLQEIGMGQAHTRSKQAISSNPLLKGLRGVRL